MNRKPVNGVLLDIDGTLVESNDAHAHAWVEALAETGRTVPFDAIRPLIGMGGDKLLPKVRGLDAEAGEGKHVSKRRGDIFLADYLPRLSPTRGAKDLLDRLRAKGLRLVVASSAKTGELEPLMKLCGADRLCESATSSDDAGASKPDPDILQAALQSLGIPAAQAVMIGDTPYDVVAGKRAGVRVIALRCGGWDDAGLQGAVAVSDDPADLAAHLHNSPLFK